MGKLASLLAGTVLVFLPACGRPFDPDAFIRRYVALRRAHDIDGLLALHADDAEFVIPGRNPVRGRNALRDLFEWDAVLGVEVDMRDVSLEGDTIRVDTIIERNRFFEALGVPEVRYRPGTRFVLRDGLIAAVRAADLDEETQDRVRPAYRRLLAWLSANRPDDLALLLPDGRLRCDAASARRWVELLAEWRAGDAAAPSGAARRGPQAGAGTIARQLVAAAMGRLSHDVVYDGGYRRIRYPGGDVPDGIGVCTDLVIRVYRAAGIDLQRAVHEDMKADFDAYPKLWGLRHPDPNIDHRRVPNLQVFFERQGAALPVTSRADDYRPGDLVTWMLPGNLPHIGIVVARRSPDGNRPLVVHNVGAGPALEDVLFAYPITGHYRYEGPPRPSEGP